MPDSFFVQLYIKQVIAYFIINSETAFFLKRKDF